MLVGLSLTLIMAATFAIFYVLLVSIMEPTACFCSSDSDWVTYLGYLTVGLDSYLAMILYLYFFFRLSTALS